MVRASPDVSPSPSVGSPATSTAASKVTRARTTSPCA